MNSLLSVQCDGLSNKIDYWNSGTVITGLKLSYIFVCISVILDDHSRYHQSWDWLTTYELTTGSGVSFISVFIGMCFPFPVFT